MIKSEPKYAQLVSQLKSQIHDGTYAVGAQIPSQNKLMRDFHLSYATVMRALQELVSDGYLFRINGKGTFVSERRPIATPIKSKLLGVSLSTIDGRRDCFCTYGMSAIESTAREYGYRVIITCSDDNPDTERTNIESLCEHGVAGIILWYVGGETNISLLDRLTERGIPYVFYDRYVLGYHADHVTTDNYRGAFEAVRFLANMGHNRVACFTNNELVSSSADRLRAFRDARSEMGLEEDDSLIQTSDYRHLYDHSLRLARRLLKDETGPLGIFSINGTVTRAIWHAITECGRGEDSSIALSCFDEPGIAVPNTIPFMRVIQPFDEMGSNAVEVLMGKLAGQTRDFRIALSPSYEVQAQGKSYDLAEQAEMDLLLAGELVVASSNDEPIADLAY